MSVLVTLSSIQSTTNLCAVIIHSKYCSDLCYSGSCNNFWIILKAEVKNIFTFSLLLDSFQVGQSLYTKGNLLLCKRDYLRLFGSTGYCAACRKVELIILNCFPHNLTSLSSQVIPAFEMVMRARANVYHLECFACQQCGHRFCVGDHFYLHDNQVHILIQWIGLDQFSNSTKPMAGAVRPRLRGADGVCLSLLPPNSTCSTQANLPRKLLPSWSAGSTKTWELVSTQPPII